MKARKLCQPSQQFLRRDPAPKAVQPRVGIPLGKPPSVGGQQEGEVDKLRRRQPQELLKIQLPGGGGQQVRPPDHLRHTHGGVVHHDRQLIGKHAV